ncbi:MAG: c-type cytochrome [Bacteroidota bacterium]
MKKAYQIILGTIMLVACGTTKLIQPTQADAERGGQKFSNLSLDQLVQGKALYEQNCALCHGLKKPGSRNEAQWNKIVPAMSAKVNRKKGEGTLSSEKQDILMRYLVTMGNNQSK